MKISDKIYDILKWLVIIVLPAAGTLYAALSVYLTGRQECRAYVHVMGRWK